MRKRRVTLGPKPPKTPRRIKPKVPKPELDHRGIEYPAPVPVGMRASLPLAFQDADVQAAARDPLAERIVRSQPVVVSDDVSRAAIGQMLPYCLCDDVFALCDPRESCRVEGARCGRPFVAAIPADRSSGDGQATTFDVDYVAEVQGAEPGELVPACRCTGLLGLCRPQDEASCPRAARKAGRAFFDLRTR